MAPRYSSHSLFNCPRWWRSTDFLVEEDEEDDDDELEDDFFNRFVSGPGEALEDSLSLSSCTEGAGGIGEGSAGSASGAGGSARRSLCCLGAVIPEPRLAAARVLAKTSSASRVHSPFIPDASFSFFWTEASAELMTSRVTGNLDG